MKVVFVGSKGFCRFYSLCGGNYLICEKADDLGALIDARIERDSMVLVPDNYSAHISRDVEKRLDEKRVCLSTLPSFEKT